MSCTFLLRTVTAIRTVPISDWKSVAVRLWSHFPFDTTGVTFESHFHRSCGRDSKLLKFPIGTARGPTLAVHTSLRLLVQLLTSDYLSSCYTHSRTLPVSFWKPIVMRLRARSPSGITGMAGKRQVGDANGGDSHLLKFTIRAIPGTAPRHFRLPFLIIRQNATSQPTALANPRTTKIPSTISTQHRHPLWLTHSSREGHEHVKYSQCGATSYSPIGSGHSSASVGLARLLSCSFSLSTSLRKYINSRPSGPVTRASMSLPYAMNSVKRGGVTPKYRAASVSEINSSCLVLTANCLSSSKSIECCQFIIVDIEDRKHFRCPEHFSDVGPHMEQFDLPTRTINRH